MVNFDRIIRDIGANRDALRKKAKKERNSKSKDIYTAQANALNTALWIINREIMLARMRGSDVACGAIPVEHDVPVIPCVECDTTECTCNKVKIL